MKISVKESIVKNLNEDVLIIPVFKDTHNTETLFLELDNILNKLLTQTIYENKDICEEYKLNLFYTPARIKLRRILLAGVGKIEEMDQEKIRLLGGKLAGFCTSNSMSNVAFLNFGYSLKNIAIKEAEIICRNVNLVRDLVNKPSNILTPEIYAKVIKETFRKTKVKVKVMEFDQIKKEKMGCIIGVGKGSEEKPKLVLLAYTPQKPKKTIAR